MPKLLPSEYEKVHDFAFFLHDELANIVVEGEQKDFFSVSLTANDDSSKEVIDALIKAEDQNLDGAELWDWLEVNGFSWVNRHLAYKQLIAALLSDACQFVYEALQTSESG